MNNILNKTYVLSVDLTDESCKSMKKAVPSQSSFRQATETPSAAGHGNISVSPASHNKPNTNHWESRTFSRSTSDWGRWTIGKQILQLL